MSEVLEQSEQYLIIYLMNDYIIFIILFLVTFKWAKVFIFTSLLNAFYIGNSKSKDHAVAFNKLPDLVKEWDRTKQDKINDFQW